LSDKHPTLFLTDRSERHQQAALQAAPPELEVVMSRRPPREQIMSLLPQVEFLITERSGIVNAEMIKRAGRLRLIQRLGSLVYDIDLGAASAAGIPVCAVPVWGSMLVAEHMLMQMLALAKRLPEISAVAKGEYPQENGSTWGESRRTDENVFAYKGITTTCSAY
jgi:phosphoglycerate dehydrogenase-like enzyme